MASPHFVLFPFMAQGHMIPMIDLAKLLAQRGAIITIVTTPHNAARNHSVLARALHSGLQIHVHQLEFPSNEAGLPEGCENLDMLPSFHSLGKFFRATHLLREPSQKLVHQLTPRPTCIISDSGFPWTLPLAQQLRIPRLVLFTHSCFFLLAMRALQNIIPPLLTATSSDSKFVTFSSLPHAVQFRKSQLPRFTDEEVTKYSCEMAKADGQSHGVVVNIFEEMEPEFVAEYKKQWGSPERVWCVGPVSLCNDNELDMGQRGKRASIDAHECMAWLDMQRPSSVVYVSLGSLCNLSTPQLVEMGSGLEESKRPFIWVIRKESAADEELQKWLVEHDLEGKTKGRGLVIRGWAPQVLILSHPAIGCFLTHCGWNSSTEAISAGAPMITWPLFGDQIFNAKLIVEILKIGVGVGLETALDWEGDPEKRLLVKRERVREAIEMVMDGDGSEEMRKRCKQLAETAKTAIQEGGSSHRNLKLLIEDIITYGSG